MAKQRTEDELNIKRKARRRLVGAVTIALAVVVILPMVLDSEPKSTGKDIELRIPAPDKMGEFVPGVAISEVVNAETQAESAAVEGTASGSTAAPDAVAAAPVADAGQNAPVKMQAAAIKQTEARSAEKSAGTYVVQVGAFSSAGKATQEVDRLKAWGFNAYTESTGGTVRVRVGPYAERDKADKVRLLLEKHGIHPVVTAVK